MGARARSSEVPRGDQQIIFDLRTDAQTPPRPSMQLSLDWAHYAFPIETPRS